jgi:tetratricopeptide (TPR) repeat protein
MRAAAERTIALDPESAEGQAQLASVLSFYERQYREAEIHYSRALSLDSTNATAGAGYAWQLWALGHGDSALSVVRRAIRHNPLSALVFTAAFEVTEGAGTLDSAATLCRRAAEIANGPHVCETELLLARGKNAEAVEAQRAVLSADRRSYQRATMARALARAGRSDEAARELAALESLSRTQYVDGYHVAAAYAAMANTAKALEWLERGLASDAAEMQLLAVDPHFASLRSEPRFQSIVRRAGLP